MGAEKDYIVFCQNLRKMSKNVFLSAFQKFATYFFRSRKIATYPLWVTQGRTKTLRSRKFAKTQFLVSMVATYLF